MKKTRRKKHKSPPTVSSATSAPAIGANTHSKKTFLKDCKIIGLFFAIICSVLTLVGAYFQFQPLVSVTPDTSLNPKSAFSTPFSICNESPLSIYKVSIQYGVNKILGERSTSFEGFSVLEPQRPIIEELEPKESMSLFISFPFNKPTFADIVVTVKYRPSFLWWIKTQKFRFVTGENADGQFVWYRKAKAKPG